MKSLDLIESVKAAVTSQNIDRRAFLKLTGVAGGGLVLASVTPASTAKENLGSLVGSVELNAFVMVSSDGTITIYSSNPEMGQGVKTALPMIIAEEMGARWEDVKVLQSPIDANQFGDQWAGGSMTVPRTFDEMRRMGAAAREMFISAGSEAMEVSRDELKAAESRVTHTTGKFLTYGQLAALAIKQKVPDPESLTFKAREDYTIIGTSVSGVDNMMISTGLALFGIDTRVPDMLYAAYHKCPAIGGKVVSANISAVRKMPGVVDAFIVKGNGNVRELIDGVAIVGTTTWAAFNARQKLEVEWDESTASKDSWTEMVSRATSLHGQRGPELVINKGDVGKAYSESDNTTLEAFYEYPFVSHLTMEPMNCTADYRKGSNGEPDSLELWIPTQFPSRAYEVTKSMFGLDDEQVTIHQMRLGGSFGRRVYWEYICESIEISKRVGNPVKLTWSREDDLQHDFYRVGGFQSVKGSVDKAGKLVAFENHFIGMNYDGKPVSGSRFSDTEFPIQNIDNAYASKTMFDIKTPCGPWRAPGSNTTAFVMQSFLNELSHAAGRDYVEFLLETLGERRWFEEGNIRSLNTGRASDVIKLAAKESGWGRKMPQGSGLGLAFYFCHAAHVAEVAEVSIDKNNKLTVHNVTVAVDVGPIINMSGATAQVEGAVIDGLSTMMGQKITMENGRTEQSNFHNYEVLRMPDAPKVDIHFIQSKYAPTGLGEPALPPLAPAVGNAIFAINGHRIRKMPFTEEGYTI
jgi:isoquinoline 1-oxidoreductase beta subunit